MNYSYLGNTNQSFAFRQTSSDGNINDFGVFDFPAQYDDEGHEITPAHPYFSTYFLPLLDDNFNYIGTNEELQVACIVYLTEI